MLALTPRLNQCVSHLFKGLLRSLATVLHFLVCEVEVAEPALILEESVQVARLVPNEKPFLLTASHLDLVDKVGYAALYPNVGAWNV